MIPWACERLEPQEPNFDREGIVQMTPEHGSIEQMLDAYKTAVYAKNVDAFVALYRCRGED